MGADFIDKVKPSFQKRWDRSLIRLRQGDLFDLQQVCKGRALAADYVGTPHLKPGDRVTLRCREQGLVVMHGNVPVGEVSAPEKALFQQVRRSAGIVDATIEEMHPISRVMEVSTC